MPQCARSCRCAEVLHDPTSAGARCVMKTKMGSHRLGANAYLMSQDAHEAGTKSDGLMLHPWSMALSTRIASTCSRVKAIACDGGLRSQTVSRTGFLAIASYLTARPSARLNTVRACFAVL